jgi:hypothetical protein
VLNLNGDGTYSQVYLSGLDHQENRGTWEYRDSFFTGTEIELVHAMIVETKNTSYGLISLQPYKRNHRLALARNAMADRYYEPIPVESQPRSK